MTCTTSTATAPELDGTRSAIGAPDTPAVDHGRAWSATHSLAEILGVTVDTVIAALRELQAIGMIDIDVIGIETVQGRTGHRIFDTIHEPPPGGELAPPGAVSGAVSGAEPLGGAR